MRPYKLDKRRLQIRVNEHRSDINKKTGSPSVISDHGINNRHQFNWNEVEVLDREPLYNK